MSNNYTIDDLIGWLKDLPPGWYPCECWRQDERQVQHMFPGGEVIELVPHIQITLRAPSQMVDTSQIKGEN